jgi:hypothetical protein
MIIAESTLKYLTIGMLSRARSRVVSRVYHEASLNTPGHILEAAKMMDAYIEFKVEDV